MPVELDFWAQNLNRAYREQEDLSDYSTEKYHRKDRRNSIFETD